MTNRLHASAVVIMVLITSAMLASVCAGRAVTCPTDMTGMDMFDDRRSDLINPDTGMNMDIAYPERFEMGATSSDNSFTYGISAGDLNGDGADDVLIFNGTYTSSGFMGTYVYDYVSAVNGHDGTELWGQDIAYETMILGIGHPADPIGDIDGVAGADVVMESYSYDSGTNTHTVTIQVKQGSDGTELWSHSVTGDGQYGTSLYSYWYSDLVGDDLNDAVVVLQSYNSSDDTTTCTLRVMHGSDGTEVWNENVTEDSSSYVPLLRFCLCGDICGDDKDDVVMVSRKSDTTSTVRALQGSTGDKSWDVSLEGTTIYVGPCGDLSGDSRGDLAITAQNYDSVENETACTVYAVQGSNGNELWNKNATRAGEHNLFLLHAYPCGNLVGSASDDLIIGSRIYDSGAGTVTTATLSVLQGTNGQEFWDRNITGEAVSLVAFSHTNLYSDGNDVIVWSTSYNSTASERTCTICAVQGSNGDEFWSQSVTGDSDGDEDGAYIWAYPYYDLDGDGKDEVIVDSWSYDSTTGDTTATVTVRDGDTPNVFWSDSITGPNASMSASSYGDLDGSGKDDVVVTQSCDSGAGNTTASVCVKKDNTETVLWDDSVTGRGVWMRANCYTSWQYQPDQCFDNDDLEDLLITTGASIDVYMNIPPVGNIYLGSFEIPTRVCAVKGNTGTSLWCEPSSETPIPPATGDLNGDDAITPADAVIVLDIIVSGGYSDDADVNGDGVTNSLDAFMILQAAAGAITL
jgi:hypothetical protein